MSWLMLFLLYNQYYFNRSIYTDYINSIILLWNIIEKSYLATWVLQHEGTTVRLEGLTVYLDC